MSVINEKDLKRAKLKAWLREKKEATVRFVSENKTWLIPLAISAVGVAAKQGAKFVTAHKQENVKELFWYDPSAGHYWKLRRKLDAREALEVDRRHQAGERLGDILEDMKVLK